MTSINVDLEFSASVFDIAISTLLKPWAGNPRKVINPRREEIKNSILANGYQGVLTVTRDPETDFYVPRWGGNTRAELLLELVASSSIADKLKVSFEPWPGEAQLYSDAVIENSANGAMNSVDTAIALVQILKWEFIDKEYSFNSGSAHLKEKGHNVSPAKLKAYHFLVNNTLVYMENQSIKHLNKNMGPSVQIINDIDRLVKAFVAEGIGEGLTQPEMDSVIGSAFSYVDNEDFSIDRLMISLEKNLSQNITKSPLEIKESIDRSLRKEHVAPNSKKKNKREKLESKKSTASNTVQLATDVATAVGIQGVILPFEKGVRYFVELPIEPLNGQQRVIWWHLVSLSGQLGAQDRIAHLPNSSMLKQYFTRKENEEIKRLVGPTPPLTSFFERMVNVKLEFPKLGQLLSNLDRELEGLFQSEEFVFLGGSDNE